MRKIISIQIVILLASTVFANAQERYRQRPPQVTILKNLNIVDVENSCILEQMDIRVEGGIIKTIDKGLTAVEEHEREMDMAGKYAIPGLIDAHVHPANSAALKYEDGAESLRFYLRGGVTSMRDVGGDARLLAAWKRAVDIGELEGPDIFYSAFLATRDYYGDPSHDKAMMGGMDTEFCAWAQLVNPGDDLDAVMTAAKAIGATGVKIYLGYDKEFTRQLVEAARRHGLEPWAHAMLFPAKPSEVAEAGVKVLSHAYMFEWENTDAEMRGRNTQDAYKHHADLDRSDIDMSEYIRIALRDDVILDATLYISSQNGLDAHSFDVVKKVYRAGAKVAAGTDWFIMPEDELPPIYKEIDLLVDSCGFSNMDAIRSATIIAAETFAGQARKGSIAEGKDADIVILGANPIDDIANLKKIEHVIKKGKFVGGEK